MLDARASAAVIMLAVSAVVSGVPPPALNNTVPPPDLAPFAPPATAPGTRQRSCTGPTRKREAQHAWCRQRTAPGVDGACLCVRRACLRLSVLSTEYVLVCVCVAWDAGCSFDSRTRRATQTARTTQKLQRVSRSQRPRPLPHPSGKEARRAQYILIKVSRLWRGRLRRTIATHARRAWPTHPP